MLDFTSVLYLGFRHAHSALRPWAQLTTGRPAALEPAPEAVALAQDLARLLRCERAVLAPSTLHLFWDLFDVLTNERIAIYVDAGTYPIARFGVERAAAKGIPTSTFPMHDPPALDSLLHRDERAGRRPIVVTDGLCAATGRIAPLPAYLKLVRERNGYLVIDDTQALSILGKGPARDAPYGRGGAGTPAWHGVEGPELIIGSSLAKGFGAPLAVLAGNARLIAKFEELSGTRVHSSPPSLAVVSAAQRALAINEKQGDYLRSHLAELVRHFRASLRHIGLLAAGGLFPVQTLRAIPGIDPESLYRRLLTFGVRAVLRSARHATGDALTFLINVLHSRSDISRCVHALRQSCLLMRHERANEASALNGAGFRRPRVTHKDKRTGRMAMSVELNFEATPLEAYDGFRTPASEQTGFELEEEFGRGGRGRSPGRGFAPRAPRMMSKRPATPPISRPGKPKIPPYPPPRVPPYPRLWPRGTIDVPYGVALEPYSVVPEPYPAEPAPTGSEYMRWVQSALNDVLGFQLPLHGIGDEATRDAIRSFQRREQLPADGVVGPDTERALLAARSEASPPQVAPGSDRPSEPRTPTPAGELNFDSESFPEFESVSPACKPEPGELAASRASAGILTNDVENTSRGILVADFGIDWRSVKDKAKRQLAPWIHRFETDPTIIEIRIRGYSDCIGPGDARYHTALRRERALRVRDLLGPVAQKKVKFVGPAPLGTFFGPNADRAARARNRSVLIEYRREITFEPEPVPPPHPAPQRPPPSSPPPIVPKPKPVPPDLPPWLPPIPPHLPPWRPPSVSTQLPPSDPGGPSWVWGPLGLAATVLGMTVSIGLRSLTAAELAELIDAAWLVFQLEGHRPLTTVMGMAGEAVAEKFMSLKLGVDAAKIYNLNNLQKNFPVADIISPRGLFSVKVRGLLGTAVGAARAPSLTLEYIQDLVDLAVGGPAEDRKLARAASLLFDNRGKLKARGAWPTGFNPRSIAEIERYIREKTVLVIPDDHVQPVKRAIGEALYKRVKSGNIRLPAGTDPVTWVNSFVDRVLSIGRRSSDFDAILEAAKHIPREQIPRLRRELDKLRQRRGP